jgi:hypothetical protein
MATYFVKFQKEKEIKMLQDYSQKKVCVVDNGLFLETSVKLAEFFGTVYYYSPWQETNPRSINQAIGFGIPGITRANNIFKIIDDVDLWVFPDLYYSDLQLHLESLGCRVWGSREGENLELNRVECKKILKELKLPVGPFVVITGLDNLSEYLKEHDNQFVKVSVTRGDFESFSSPNYNLIKSRLDRLANDLGIVQEIARFIVEDEIEGVELGYDGYCIDGEFPESALLGLEIKDLGYIGRYQPYASMPKEITDFTRAIGPFMKENRYRNFCSTENRITPELVSYMNDFCGRQGSPPSELYINMFGKNLADILWFGAEGKLVSPDCPYEWGMSVCIYSDWLDKNCLAVEFPAELRDNIKFRNAMVVDGKYYCVPQNEGIPVIGDIVAMGHSLQEVRDKISDISKEIKGYKVELNIGSLDKAQEEIEKLAEIGVDFEPRKLSSPPEKSEIPINPTTAKEIPTGSIFDKLKTRRK